MRIFNYLLRTFIQFFFIIWLMLVIFLVGINLISTFTTYFVSYGLSSKEIILSSVYYIPTTMVLSMPFAVLFASSYIFGSMSMQREVLGLISLGYSPFQLVKPQILISFFLCIMSFFIAEYLAVDSFNKQQILLKLVQSSTDDQFTIFREPQKNLFYSQHYSESDDTFYDVIILIFDKEHTLLQRIDARSAFKANNIWILQKVRILNTNAEKKIIHLNEMRWTGNPTIGRINSGVRMNKKLSLKEVKTKIKALKEKNMSYQNEYVNFLQRITDPLDLIINALPAMLLVTGQVIGITTFALEYILIVAFIKIFRTVLISFATKSDFNPIIAIAVPIILSISVIFFLYMWKNNLIGKRSSKLFNLS